MIFQSLWDEIEILMDAYGWTAGAAMKFLAENADMYPEEIGDQLDEVLEITEWLFEGNDTGVLH